MRFKLRPLAQSNTLPFRLVIALLRSNISSRPRFHFSFHKSRMLHFST